MFAHPCPRPLGVAPGQLSLRGKAVQRRFEAAEHQFAGPLSVGLSDIAEQGRGRDGRGCSPRRQAWDAPVLGTQKAFPHGIPGPERPPGNPSTCVRSGRARSWWRRAERLAGLEPKHRRGWHSLRRKFASDLMDQPLKVLCELGGWKTARTVLQCYQHADEDQLRNALDNRRRVRA